MTDAEDLFREELRERQARRPTGWLHADEDEFGDRDITKDRCRVCGDLRTPELHDPCIARLPGVMQACCGHGRAGRAYIVGIPFGRLCGPAAARKMKELGGRPPQEAFLLDPIDGAA